MTMRVDTVVIGAGQAGLNTSRALQMVDIDHVVLERGRIGHTWSTQRWDSFRLNTPNWANGLLGWDYDGPDPDGFMSAGELSKRMRAYAARFELPICENTSVSRVNRIDDEFTVETSGGDRWTCRNVVVCSGAQNVPRVPEVADRIPGVAHLHSSEYRRPEQLTAGGVLVVGGAQTGAQIAAELAAVGRDTYLATSDVGSVPRRYRGRDIGGWMFDMGVLNTPVGALDDPSSKYAAQPLMTGVDGGHTVTLHGLARRGITLLGRLQDADGTTLRFGDDLTAHAAKGLASIAGFCSNVDQFIAAAGLDAPPPDVDDALEVAPEIDEMSQVHDIDLAARGVGTVIWATGFRGKFSYLDVGLRSDSNGVPVQRDGASEVPGLWFCGFPWLRIQSSGLIHGSAIDAQAVVEQIATANAVRPWPAQTRV